MHQNFVSSIHHVPTHQFYNLLHVFSSAICTLIQSPCLILMSLGAHLGALKGCQPPRSILGSIASCDVCNVETM